MVRVDWTTLICMAMLISIITEYLSADRLFEKFSNYLLDKNHLKLYTFFFCRFCMIGKLAMIAPWIERPVMFLETYPYRVWTITEFTINFLVINFVALGLDGLILQRAFRSEPLDSQVEGKKQA